MMQALREELDLQNVPVILGGLGDFLADCPADVQLQNYVYANAALKEIAANDPLVGFAPAEGLSSNPNKLHFNAASLCEFGLRYLEAFEKLHKGIPVKTTQNADLSRSEMELL